MDNFIKLINLFYKEVFNQEPQIKEADINYLKNTIVVKGKQFFQWLIDNGHIEEIPSDKKSGPGINDYIKYIADTEDPVKTLVNMLK